MYFTSDMASQWGDDWDYGKSNQVAKGWVVLHE